MSILKSASLRVAAYSTLPLAALTVDSVNAEGFFEDSSARLDLRNFYLNRDFRDGSGQNKREEWAQGFIFNLRSGYTPGTVGFGVDALAMLGVKLDSSPDRTGTGLLPTHKESGRAAGEYSKLGLTAKGRISNSELKIGTLIPKLPTVQPNDGRILPQVFRGGQLTSKEWDDLTINAGRLNLVTARDQSHAQKLALNNKNRRFSGAVDADHFDFAGIDYTFTPGLAGSYHLARLDDVYRQQFFGLQHAMKVGEGTFKSDVRLSVSDDQGRSLGGDVDNRALNGMFTYSHSGHSIGGGYQRMFGDTGFAYINGTNPYLVNFLQLNDFAQAKERSWQARYDFDFAKLDVPGLTFMTRYVNGSHAEYGTAGTGGREWERNIDVQYRVQSGALKNVGLRWRHASYRSTFARDMDEHRVIVSYSVPVW